MTHTTRSKKRSSFPKPAFARASRIGIVALLAGAALVFGARPAFAAEQIFSIEPPAIDEPMPPSHEPTSPSRQETAVFAGGCFWGVQAVFQHVKGVSQALSGYAGGSAETARYSEVSSGATGHAESVQGPDTGTQYRSAVFAVNPRQHEIAQAYIAQLDKSGAYPKPLATTVEDLKGFYPAESYHQDYLVHNMHSPYIVINDLPKIRNLAKAFGERYRDEPVLVGE